MALHLLRFASGHTSIEDIRSWQVEMTRRAGRDPEVGPVPFYIRNRRRRSNELVGNSLYWVIDGAFACRQAILDFKDGVDPDGRGFTHMMLDPALVPVDRWPRKNFGGWRYLNETQVPADQGAQRDGSEEMPGAMRDELMRLGLL
jgi:hypothetical protein